MGAFLLPSKAHPGRVASVLLEWDGFQQPVLCLLDQGCLRACVCVKLRCRYQYLFRADTVSCHFCQSSRQVPQHKQASVSCHQGVVSSSMQYYLAFSSTWCCAGTSVSWKWGAVSPGCHFVTVRALWTAPQELLLLWAGAVKEELRQNWEILGLKIHLISVCGLQTPQIMGVLLLLCCLLTDLRFIFLWVERPWGTTF